ncbi:MAG: hypothetical protein IJI47_00560 [Eubacterium sp.]|nr:hypothetical protein [Eubacterium sp.]
MKSMGFNFIKRAVVIPAVTAVVAVAVVLLAVRFAPSSQQDSVQSAQTDYPALKFGSVAELKEGDYIGKLIFDGETEKPVTFADAVGDSLVAAKKSADPWKKGGFVVKGTGSSAQLGDVRNLKKGDRFSFEVSGHGTYNYKITSVSSGMRDENISAFTEGKSKDKNLFICRSYNDFASDGKTKLYVVYAARQIGGGNG